MTTKGKVLLGLAIYFGLIIALFVIVGDAGEERRVPAPKRIVPASVRLHINIGGIDLFDQQGGTFTCCSPAP